MSIEDNVFSEFEIDFIKKAKAFCLFIEANDSTEGKDFLLLAKSHLISLYVRAGRLSFTYVPDDKAHPNMISDDSLNVLTDLVTSSLKNNRYYWHVINPVDDRDMQAVCGDLFDDLRDIYKDIKESLLLFDLHNKEAEVTAFWNLKFKFDNHWGDHCINAIYAIHYFLRKLVDL